MKNAVFVVSLMMSVTITPAMAGFQWTPPAQMPAPVQQSAPQVAPNIMMEETVDAAPEAVATSQLPESLMAMPDNQAAEVVAPVITTQDAPAIVTETVMDEGIQWPSVIGDQPVVAAQTPMVEATPTPLMPMQDREAAAMTASTTMQAPVQTMPLPATQSNYQVVEGFGRDLPLVMAVRQIVPDQYGYAFAEGTPLNATVSWEGGRAWDQVLYEVLSPLGYKAAIGNQLVSVMPSTASGLSASATYVQPAPAVQVTAAPEPIVEKVSFELVTPNTAPATPMQAVNAPTPSPLMQQVAYQSNTMTSSVWTAGRDMTLRQILESWANRAGVELYWASEFDYPVSSAVTIQGTFEEAVQTLLKGLEDAKPKPLGRLHPNLPSGPAVLVIETRQVLD